MAFEPAYLETYRSGRLADKVAQAREELRQCHACPRNCGVDRLRGRTAACYTGRNAYVSSFFAHCNLRCVFCQNWDISQQETGLEVTSHQLAAIMLRLQAEGCHNINLVTPEHVAPQIVEALPEAIEGGLRLPLVYNTSAYDAPGSLALMDGLVDIYMPDFKIWDPEKAFRLLKARDYPAVARAAIAEMFRQVGDLRLNVEGIAERGLLIRHMVMPDGLEDTRNILHWIATHLSRSTYLNVMNQYRPLHKARDYPEIDRTLQRGEFLEALNLARDAGLTRLDGHHISGHAAF